MANPLLEAWGTPHGLPPFAALQPAHFEPALRHAMALQREELAAIAANPAAPDFDNTVAAFDRSGRLLGRVAAAFYNLTSSATSAELQAVQRDMAGPMAAHASAILTDPALFARLDALHERRGTLALAPEQHRLLERLHLDFVRAGARLAPEARLRHSELMQELARLQTQFGQNLLHDEGEFLLPLQGEDDLAGLPEPMRDVARQAAAERGLPGHAVRLVRSQVMPFLSFSTRRDLRQRVWQAWSQRGEHEGEHDNRPVARKILRLRRELAALHGRACYADHALADTMAGARSAVQGLLDAVWPRALAAASREREMLLAEMKQAGETSPLLAWDWRFWAEKVRQRRFQVDDAEVKPYFELSRVVAAAFDCAQRLFGLRFEHRADLPVYHPDVQAYEVFDAAGRLVGVFLQDNFARANKRSGAWMSSLRWQHRNGEQPQLPVILNNNNFAKGAPGAPTLLSLDDARTLFHEFGHGLHGLLSSVTYERLSGTQVLRDFVELPSQIFEHWIAEPEVLQRHARHFQTGAPIPADLVQRLQAAARFGQGYETVRYTASAIIDLTVHSLTEAEPPADLSAFEAEVLANHGHPAEVGVNHRFVHFQHLFAGSAYASGYYVYLWAEVLDADGFGAFTEAGSAFDPATAARLLKHVYAAGNSVEPRATYAAFRGRDATVEPLLRKRGLLEPA